MKAIEILQQYWDVVNPFFIHAQYCALNDVRTPECRDFWTAVMYTCFGLAALLTIPTVAAVIKERLAFYRSRQSLDPPTVVADQISTDEIKPVDASDPDITHEEYATMIREFTNSHSAARV
jgi:hypothetical protein